MQGKNTVKLFLPPLSIGLYSKRKEFGPKEIPFQYGLFLGRSIGSHKSCLHMENWHFPFAKCSNLYMYIPLPGLHLQLIYTSGSIHVTLVGEKFEKHYLAGKPTKP